MSGQFSFTVRLAIIMFNKRRLQNLYLICHNGEPMKGSHFYSTAIFFLYFVRKLEVKDEKEKTDK